MRKRQRFAFLAIGGLGLLAAVAPGLAAGIQTPSAANAPAAGQGSVAVQGFVVEDINWSLSNDGAVTEVTFKVFRATDCIASGDPVTYDCDGASSTVDSENATVRASLTTVDGQKWEPCTVTAGEATCEPSGTIEANKLTEVEILAFDSTPPAS